MRLRSQEILVLRLRARAKSRKLVRNLTVALGFLCCIETASWYGPFPPEPAPSLCRLHDDVAEEWRRTASENAQAALCDIRISIGDYPTAKELATISRPVLCTCGSRSAPKMVRVTRKLARVIPTGVFRQIDAAGHAATFDAPSNFVRVVREVVA